MRTLPNRRWRLAIPVMMAALMGIWLASRPISRSVSPREFGADEPLAAAQAATVAPEPARASASAGGIVDIFGVRTWEPPPPPPPPAGAEPVAPPAPPPLPFRFFGRIEEAGKPIVFLLLEGERIRQVRVGDRIGGNYRVLRFDENRLYFRYEPMKVTQALAIGNMP